MARPRGRDIIRRSKANPIITVEDLGFRCSDICNASAIKHNGEYLLLLTIESLEDYFEIYKARSRDGYTFEVEDEPFLTPEKVGPMAPYESRGLIDARVVPLDDDYYICFDLEGEHGFCLGLARTKDFHTVQNLGMISQPDTKAGTLFPEKINGRYARLERPWNGGSIWLTFSDDLVFWGGSEVVMTPRAGFWDANRIGAATPPYRISEGWLLIYYGIKDTSAGPLFRMGAAILDYENPTIVLGRTNIPILSPREMYERIGDVNNLVFSCGAIIEPDNEFKLYYGAANSCLCIGTTNVRTIVEACFESEKEF